MKQIIAFIKKNYLLCLSLISIILLVFIFPAIEKKGTYSLNSLPSVSIECPDTTSEGSTVNCDIKLNPAGEKILSVNANYDLPEGIAYSSFTAKNGFENYAVDEEDIASQNGFAIVNLDGVTSETIVGTLTVKIPDDAIDNASYTIGLKAIELSNDEYEMIETQNATASDEVMITTSTSSDELQINDLIVDEEKMLITRLSLGTKYGSLKEHFVTNGIVTIISNDEVALTDNDIVKTGDKIKIELSNETKTYTLSVLGDVTGDGIVLVSDVGTLYKHLKKRITLNEEQVAAGNIINDETILVNDVNILYKYLKHRISSLEVN